MKGVEVDTTIDCKFVFKNTFSGLLKIMKERKYFFGKDFLQFSKFDNLDFFNKI